MSKTKNPGEALPSVLILGDQLNPNISSLAGKSPDNCRILMVENTSKIEESVSSGTSHLCYKLQGRKFFLFTKLNEHFVVKS